MSVKYEAEIVLMEECGELIQSLSKIIRTDGAEKYVKQMKHELADVVALTVYIQKKYEISREEMVENIDKKINKLKKWSNLYSEESDADTV